MALSVALARIWIAGVIGDLRTASRDMTAHGEVEARGSEAQLGPVSCSEVRAVPVRFLHADSRPYLEVN